jgi:hypothetical protein
MTMEADDIVEDRDILSVDALSRELNNAVRFFFACFVAVEAASPASAALLCSPAAWLASGEEDEGVPEDSSSEIACEGLMEKARRIRPLSPPLRMAAELGRGSSSSLSSRDMRFSAVETPCDSGEGRAGRGVGACSTDEPDCEVRVTEEVEEEEEGLR